MTIGAPKSAVVALTKIVEADYGQVDFFTQIQWALGFILLACIFDMLDGRLARWGGSESPFGREFDSLADMVSFGVAPAFLVYRIVLHEFEKTGWLIAAAYSPTGPAGIGTTLGAV
jgi:CDP-diacylglycerol--serine O-phosphatidyltransferase